MARFGKEKIREKCFFCAGVDKSLECSNVSQTMEDYTSLPEPITESIRNSAVWMLAPEHKHVTHHPQEAWALATRRLVQFDAVIPVENLFDGIKYLSYVMNLPLPSVITNVRSAKSVCGKFMSTFDEEYAAAWEKSDNGTNVGDYIDCEGRQYACYTAMNKLLKKLHPDLYVSTAGNHSPRVSDYVRRRNSLDYDLHEWSKTLWKKQWGALLEQEGQPTCEINCPPEQAEELCRSNYESTKKEIASTYLELNPDLKYDLAWDSDDVFAEAGPVMLKCKPVITGGYGVRCFPRQPHSQGSPGFERWDQHTDLSTFLQAISLQQFEVALRQHGVKVFFFLKSAPDYFFLLHETYL
jgi:hypothetical protein